MATDQREPKLRGRFKDFCIRGHDLSIHRRFYGDIPQCYACVLIKQANFRTNPANDEKRRLWQRNHKLRKFYGLTREAYNSMLKSQDYKCDICRSERSGNKKDWHVDHCHKSGRVRAILCKHCNQGLGHFRDNPSLLEKAAQYILKHRGEDNGD